MTEIPADLCKSRTPRVWPGVLLVVIQWTAWVGLNLLLPEAAIYGLIGGLLGVGAAVLLWWLFFSRLPWKERLSALVLIPLGFLATRYIVHASILSGGMGVLLFLFAIPVQCLALVVYSALSSRLPGNRRYVALATAIGLGFSSLTLLRTGGVTGDGVFDISWRWSPSPEERLLAAGNPTPAGPPKTPAADFAGLSWPGFRGPGRDGVVHDALKIATDWSRSTPVAIWRRPIGPGWSSFAIQGASVFTQEQRGEEEVVACYDLGSGQPVWMHKDPVRFWEAAAGAGPRATPTYHEGRVYTLGSTGIVNVLNATDGGVVWSKNAATDTGVKLPDWAFAGSPLVVDDLIVIATAGRLVAYDRDNGKLRWLGPAGVGGYSSPQLATLQGVRQILFVKAAGVLSVSPTDGKELWKRTWKGDGIVQPAVMAEGDVLVGSGSGLNNEVGVSRLALTHGPEGWDVQERWSSRGIRPYYNDFVIHKNHAYGFDGGVLACTDLKDGQRKWKGGRYGHGQVLLLPDQDLLLVLSEKGEVALVVAAPEQHRELTRFRAIEGKTWNHPVLVGDILLVRNGEEMAAFRLPPLVHEPERRP